MREIIYRVNNTEDKGRLLVELSRAEDSGIRTGFPTVQWTGGEGKVGYQFGIASVEFHGNNVTISADLTEQVDEARTGLEKLGGIKLKQK